MMYITLLYICTLLYTLCTANPAAKRLYDDLLVNSRYNSQVRPVANNSDPVNVYLGLRLAQLIDVVCIGSFNFEKFRKRKSPKLIY